MPGDLPEVPTPQSVPPGAVWGAVAVICTAIGALARNILPTIPGVMTAATARRLQQDEEARKRNEDFERRIQREADRADRAEREREESEREAGHWRDEAYQMQQQQHEAISLIRSGDASRQNCPNYAHIRPYVPRNAPPTTLPPPAPPTATQETPKQ